MSTLTPPKSRTRRLSGQVEGGVELTQSPFAGAAVAGVDDAPAIGGRAASAGRRRTRDAAEPHDAVDARGGEAAGPGGEAEGVQRLKHEYRGREGRRRSVTTTESDLAAFAAARAQARADAERKNRAGAEATGVPGAAAEDGDTGGLMPAPRSRLRSRTVSSRPTVAAAAGPLPPLRGGRDAFLGSEFGAGAVAGSPPNPSHFQGPGSYGAQLGADSPMKRMRSLWMFQQELANVPAFRAGGWGVQGALNASGDEDEEDDAQSRVSDADTLGSHDSRDHVSRVGGKRHGSREENMTDIWRRHVLVHPNSPSRRNWDLLLLLALLYVAVKVPYRIGFHVAAGGGWVAFEIFVDVLFWLDIVINFRTAYYSAEGILVTSGRLVARHYLRTWFAVDAVSVLPLAAIVAAATGDGERLAETNVFQLTEGERLLGLVGLISLLRLFRVVRIYRKLQAHISLNQNLLKLFRLGLVILMLAHYMACGWFFISSMEEAKGRETWIAAYHAIDAPVSDQFAASLYWSIATITTVGYGDIVPETRNERIFVVIGLIIGVTAFSYAVGTMSSLVQHIDAQSTEFQSQMAEVNAYIRFRSLDKDLAIKIREHYRRQHERQGVGFKENRILTTLSKNLRMEVADHLNTKILSGVPFLRGARPEVITAVVMRLRPQIAATHEAICEAGELARELYILTRGTAEVWSAPLVDEPQLLATLEDGSFFGEIGLVKDDARRVASVIARTTCDFFPLSKSDFETLCIEYPEAQLREKLKSFADERMAANRKTADPDDDGAAATAVDRPDEALDAEARELGVERVEYEDSSDSDEDGMRPNVPRPVGRQGSRRQVNARSSSSSYAVAVEDADAVAAETPLVAGRRVSSGKNLPYK